MTLDPQFAGSWINERHTVLGQELRPFCLWYRFLFEYTGSPFITGGPVGWVELYAAAQMCQQDYTEFLPRSWPSEADKTSILSLSRSFDLSAETEKMTEYLTDYFCPPDLWQKADKGGDDDHPPELGTIAAQVVCASGWSEKEVWMMPLGKTYWYAALFSRVNGSHIRFVSHTEDDLAVMIRMKEEYQAAKKRRAEEQAQNNP